MVRKESRLNCVKFLKLRSYERPEYNILFHFIQVKNTISRENLYEIYKMILQISQLLLNINRVLSDNILDTKLMLLLLNLLYDQNNQTRWYYLSSFLLLNPYSYNNHDDFAILKSGRTNYHSRTLHIHSYHKVTLKK